MAHAYVGVRGRNDRHAIILHGREVGKRGGRDKEKEEECCSDIHKVSMVNEPR